MPRREGDGLLPGLDVPGSPPRRPVSCGAGCLRYKPLTLRPKQARPEGCRRRHPAVDAPPGASIQTFSPNPLADGLSNPIPAVRGSLIEAGSEDDEERRNGPVDELDPPPEVQEVREVNPARCMILRCDSFDDETGVCERCGLPVHYMGGCFVVDSLSAEEYADMCVIEDDLENARCAQYRLEDE